MKNDFFDKKRILVTGGNGFLGKSLVEKLRRRGAEVYTPTARDYDLRDNTQVRKLFDDTNPEIVIHLAAKVGGIGFNQKYPGELFYDNAIMGLQVMEAARIASVSKFVAIGTVCAYPKFTPVPFKELDLWNGYPEETNAPYGLAKKMMLVQSQAYRKQYGFNSIFLLPVNLYGPNDNFDLESSHVIPGLINKFYRAISKGEKEVEIWGTGSASREFLYVDDAAEAIVLATEKYNEPEPVNIGSGMEITIKDLVSKISEIMGFNGEIRWDATKPDGQPRRCLDVSKAEKEFGFKAKTRFEEGLRKTIGWYKAQV
jgi:GDP-L-fucose synthase